jgi:hypothetical protein
VCAQCNIGRQVLRQDGPVASAKDAWVHQLLGGKESSRVLGFEDGVMMLAVLNFGATPYAHLTLIGCCMQRENGARTVKGSQGARGTHILSSKNARTHQNSELTSCRTHCEGKNKESERKSRSEGQSWDPNISQCIIIGRASALRETWGIMPQAQLSLCGRW